MNIKKQKMKIEIWSDVMCPFCYIGKVKFEIALNNFANKNEIEIEWKSFQIMPDLQMQEGKNIDDVLVQKKGISLQQAKELNGYASAMAKAVGLEYHFERVIPVNTLRAHQFQYFAKAYGKGNKAEELMFKSYFTDGKNIDDIETLIDLGKVIGLNAKDLRDALDKQTYSDAVKADVKEAVEIGITGVPFFVFNRKHTVSGAQDPKVFLDILQKSFEEWRTDNTETGLDITDGAACNVNGTCE